MRLCAAAAAIILLLVAAPPSSSATGGVISAIKVEGNLRIEAGTIRSYLLVTPGSPFDPEELSRSLKTLYATGLFKSVSFARAGDVLVVHVVENPIVNSVIFEGNQLLTDKDLTAEVQLAPRAVFTPALAASDRQRILSLYATKGHYAATVTPKIIKLAQNRVDIVFEIHEGPTTYISRIAFIGNRHFSQSELQGVINSSQHAWWLLFSNADIYVPDRVDFDQELLRRFYLNHGFIEFEVRNVRAELAPDRSSIFLTFTLEEGPRYRVGKVRVLSFVPKLSAKSLEHDVKLSSGGWYNGDAVGNTINAMANDVERNGFPFAEIRPRIASHTKGHVIDVVFDVIEGPRVYVQRIEITGNTLTEDQVIRREFHVAEGDPFNPLEVSQAEQRLKDLGFFNSVTITPEPGSSPSQVILKTNVVEKETGTLTLGGGFATDIGVLGNIGLSETDFLGTGTTASINGVLAARGTQISLNFSDPYFLGRDLLAGLQGFDSNINNQSTAEFNESQLGFTPTLGYNFNDHVRQQWSYSAIERRVFGISTFASNEVKAEGGHTFLSQLSQTLTFDWRDSTINPTRGFDVNLETDLAGLGGTPKYLRTSVNGDYYVPLTNSGAWNLSFSTNVGYLFTYNGYQDRIIDRFFLGGANLRGFADGGAGPHDLATGDALGGRFLWTESTELRFPLPGSAAFGLTGSVFADVGELTGVTTRFGPLSNHDSPRVGVGIGVAFQTPFGLVNVSVADPVAKFRDDTTQVFRFGFGTRF